MPLRIRRGTDAERLSIVPLEGELIYTIDTKKVFVGDGTTSGGVNIGVDISGAIDNDLILNGYSITGSGNINIDGTISSTLGFTGDVNGSVFANDSTILVDGVSGVLRGQLIGNVLGNVTGNVSGNLTGNVNGNLTGNVNGNVIGDVIGSVFGDVIGSVFADDSTILVDGVSGVLRGQLIGNVLGNVTGDVSGNLTGNVLGNVSGDVGGNLTGNVFGNVTGNVNGNLTGNVFGNVSGNVNGNLTGNVNGNVIGDVIGSVFADDSTVLVDSVGGVLRGQLIGNVTVDSVTTNNVDGISFLLDDGTFIFNGNIDGTTNAAQLLKINGHRGTYISPNNTLPGDFISGMSFGGWANNTGYTAGGILIAEWDATADLSTFIPSCNVYIATGKNGVSPNVFSFTHKGVFSAPIAKVGSYATGSLPSGVNAEAGMIAFDSDTNQFKGYNGTAWVVLG